MGIAPRPAGQRQADRAASRAARSAWRFAGVVFGLAVLLSVASAPAALGHPWAFLQNTVLFPLGLSKY